MDRRAYLATVGAAAGSASGCLSTFRRGGAAADAEAALLLNWKPNGLHLPYYAARANGFYDEEGLDLTGIESGQGSDFSAKQVALGNTAFAVTSSDQVVTAAARDLAPLSVGVVMQRSPVTVFTVRDEFGAEFTDPGQLSGKTVGTGPGMVHILTTLFLERTGVRGSVELVDTGYDTVQQLLAGKVDAAGGVFGDVVSARQHGATVDVVPVSRVVESYGHVLATARSFADDRPAAVRSFLRATARGAAWATNHPASAVDALVEANPSLAETRATQRATWDLLAERYMVAEAVKEHGWGWSRPEPWETTAAALAGAGITDEPVGTDPLWTNDYLDVGDEYVGGFVSATEG